MPVLQDSSLFEFGKALLAGGGATQAEAAIVARSLVDANLRGHDSHGVMRIPFYVKQVQEGRLKSGSNLTVDARITYSPSAGNRCTTETPPRVPIGAPSTWRICDCVRPIL